MLGLGAATRIYVATKATDMRLSFDGLYALVVGQLQQDPTTGHLFFVRQHTKGQDENTLLRWLEWVCSRRMEQGRLHWPSCEEGHLQLSREEFALLIGGIDLSATRKRKWYRRAPGEESDVSTKAA